ncbi:MAB_1171c family putative transporter [Streptomyces sp. B1866]|uniref:MAB_1171c family putative transporter n=1 Tax=Streptomyces sp. B1866 TaxID=3075431 RepID=UPI0028920515|nr:MAB_1171c family putative transporter [Streptomyces sp. B1866]MDT3397276.1 MAB_1171c family putative transporter [Streptomyces sp. B1866]
MSPEQLCYPLAATVGAAALLHRVGHLRQDPRNATFRALCLALGMASLAFLTATPAVHRPVSHMLGMPHLGQLVVHGSMITFCACAQRVLLAWMYPPEVARRKARRRATPKALALAAMTILMAVTPASHGTPEHFAGDHAATSSAAAYLLVYFTTVGTGVAEIARLCRCLTRAADRPWLKRGLCLTGTGALIYLGNAALSSAYVIARILGSQWDPVYTAAPIAATIGAVLAFTGLVLPNLGPRLSLARRWLQRLRAYHRLLPLWLALCDALPGLALHPPVGPCRERFRLSALDYRLHRMVTEIRDARHELRDRIDPRLLQAQQELIDYPGPVDGKQRAVLEAALIRQALGSPTPIPADSLDGLPRGLPPVGGDDYEGELAWFVLVAEAFADATGAYLLHVLDTHSSMPTHATEGQS